MSRSVVALVVVTWLWVGPGVVARADDDIARDELPALDPTSVARELARWDAVPPSDPGYALAQHRAGWACFLLDRAPDAIVRFARVLSLAPAEAPHRRESLQMLGALLADRDWDRDGRPDASTVRARLEDAALLPEGAPWMSEVWFETAHALHLTSRDIDAIALLDVALDRWPAPAEGTALEPACRRHAARMLAMPETRGASPETDAICARRAAR